MLLDIGAAGPLVGVVVSIPLLILGLSLSQVKLIEGQVGTTLGDSLLLSLISRLVIGPIPAGYDIVIHPVGFAGWIGLLVTSLNLLPVGQLDVLFLLDLPADAPCVVVDAVAGLPPGEIWVRPLAALVERARRQVGTSRGPEPRSSHELPLDEVLALAAALRDSPPAGTFVGIGGACWDVGSPLTEPVRARLRAFAAAIAAAVEAHAPRETAAP